MKFLKTVINITAPDVCAYKAQKAFFDIFDQGHSLLKEIISYTHQNYPDIPIILDCKIGDIENTMEAYAYNVFDVLKADGVVVNPYMGDDVLIPLAKYNNKSIIVLIKISNPSGEIVQDLVLQNGKQLWQQMLETTIDKWNGNENIIPVLSSNAKFDATMIRSIIPNNMPILLAGIGAQGGNFGNLRKLLNADGAGVLVNSSRGLIFPNGNGTWMENINRATIDLKTLLNNERWSV